MTKRLFWAVVAAVTLTVIHLRVDTDWWRMLGMLLSMGVGFAFGVYLMSSYVVWKGGKER